MPRPELHVFVCLNQRESGDPRGDCLGRGSQEVHTRLKDAVKEKKLNVKIRINKAGCLDQCQHGPVIVVYPEGTWYAKVSPEDVPRLIEEHLIGGRPLTDLLMP